MRVLCTRVNMQQKFAAEICSRASKGDLMLEVHGAQLSTGAVRCALTDWMPNMPSVAAYAAERKGTVGSSSRRCGTYLAMEPAR